MNTLNILLTSSIFAGIISAFVSYFISIKLKRVDFKNEYYKQILIKRLEVYEHIEFLISTLKPVVLGDDNKPYHIVFNKGENKLYESQKELFFVVNKNIWVDNKTTKQLEKLNDFFFNINNLAFEKTEEEIIEIGKKYYDKLAELRINLENSTKEGLYNLHDIEKSFKSKLSNQKREIRKL